ncbi:hypothetical protein C4569_03285 [Candidatus Parcubacteria bacterium]|nr:MAG: hypothetical protein C4569_03285 [Candidatus Parcubacteria bacterium]
MNKKGISLVETLISLSVLAVLSVSIFSLFQLALRVIAENKARTGAVSLANEKMEIVRNLAYENICIIGGVVTCPDGIAGLQQSESVNDNNINYDVTTQVQCVFDAFDGLLPPADNEPCDYKRVSITVFWIGHTGQKNLAMETAVAPKGLETSSGGVLKISVFDAGGNTVPQADVHIVKSPIDTTLLTGDDGVLLIANLEEALNSYSISATKTGFSTDQTCAINAGAADCVLGNPNPLKPHATVLDGQVTEISFAIDILSNLQFRTVSQTTPDVWQVNTGGDGEDQDNPSIAICPGGDYVFGWRDDDIGQSKLYSQRYDSDRIKLWNDGDKAIATASHQNNVDLATDSLCNSYAVWNDDRDSQGNEDAYFISYDENGNLLWGSEKKIETQADNKDQNFPKIELNSTSTFAFIVWQDNRNDNGDIFINKFNIVSNPPVALWSPEIKVNETSGSSTQILPALAVDSQNNAYVVWQDGKNLNNDIYSQKISGEGVKLWPSDIKINTDLGLSDQINADIDLGPSDNIYVVWQDDRNGNYDIYLQKYSPAGAALWENDIKVNSDSGSAADEYPAIAINNLEEIFIVWQDYRNSKADIYLQKLNSDGVKLLDYDVLVAEATGDQEKPDIAIPPPPSTQNPTITWQDNSNGDWDIKAAQYGATIETGIAVPNVPLTITGSKSYDVEGNIPKFSLSSQTDGSGILNANLIEWDTYDVIVGGSYSLISSDPVVPFLLEPNQNLTVYLNVE